MSLPPDYLERVYAGVLGKLIGVYLGRPFEGWTHERILAELGEIWYYVHEKRGVPLIVTDDDITGTFTFLRALPDYGNSPDLTPAHIGQTWLNYIVEGKSILWWGGLGYASEHTAYLRLKQGIKAPESGSRRRNGKTLSEQIGAQIFIDGWAMVAPGDPGLAADLARRAASVSHDGEAIYAAQVWAAMEAAAFTERNIDHLIDTGLAVIPSDCVISRLIRDVREWWATEPDWRKAREQLAARYGYDKYGGACHVVPNHGVMILGLLYGGDDFQKTLMITNTCGWDTDCNSGNVGCLMGVKNGLSGIDSGPDWRGPLADRLYLPTADGGRAISDAAAEAIRVANIGRALAGEASISPKNGARFHFELPGSVQGFTVERGPEAHEGVTLENAPGFSESGARSLAIRFRNLAQPRPARISTPTFIPPEAINMPGYMLLAAPTLYPGQTVRARLTADPANNGPVSCGLYLSVYGAEDQLHPVSGPSFTLYPAMAQPIEWQIPRLNGAPIAAIGLELTSGRRAEGTVYLDYLTWDGVPNTVFTRAGGTMWRRAWVEGVFRARDTRDAPFLLTHNEGTGLLITGTRDWADYEVEATITPHLCAAAGIGVRVQGMARYYALLLCDDGRLRLIKALDGESVLAEADFPWEFDNAYHIRVRAAGTRLQAWIEARQMFDVQDSARPLDSGGIALVCREGCMASGEIALRPA